MTTQTKTLIIMEKSVKEYKEQKTPRGSMKIEVVMENAKKPKKDRPGSATSIRNMEDIEKRQKVNFALKARRYILVSISSKYLNNSSINLFQNSQCISID